MRSANGLSKLYEHLTPHERFRLVIEAEARGDEGECEALSRSCPRKDYRANDDAFTTRIRASSDVSMAAAMDLCQHLSRLDVVEGVEESHPYCRVVFVNEAQMGYLDGHEAGARWAWQAAGMEGDPPGYEEDDEVAEENGDPGVGEALDSLTSRLESRDITPDLLDRLKAAVATEALEVWEGYEAFCEGELEVGPRKMLSVSFEPGVEGVDRLLSLKEELSLEADREKVEEYRNALTEGYRQRIEP